MKKSYLLTLIALCSFCLTSVVAQPLLTTPRGSQTSSITQRIGITDMTINYSSPRVNERQIWGTLIPYDQVWRAGANENTTFTVSHDVKIEGKDLAAGSYGVHILPSKDKATIIFSNNTSSWGSFSYNESEDALRVDVTPEAIDHTEWLTFEVLDKGTDFATIGLSWEKQTIPFKVEVDVHNIVISNFKDELRGVEGFFWQASNQAAGYCLNNNVELEQGLAWADQAISIQENFNTLSTKAGILEKLGKTADSKSIMDKAIALPTATAGDLYGYGRRLIGQGKKKEALEIFKINAKKNAGHWLADHGLARGYSALGDYKKALSYEKKALPNTPERSKGFLEGFVKKLEAGEDIN